MDLDEFEVPIDDRPSAFALDEFEREPALHERDAVEGLPVDELIDAIDDDDRSGADEADGVDERIEDGIDEAPDDGAIGDDDDGLGDDSSDLDESILSGEQGDDGADGVDADRVELDDLAGPIAGASDDDSDVGDPVVLPELPELDR